ncbi:MAG: 5'/3'-nucleotidase SurE [Chthonomonadales bacterium]
MRILLTNDDGVNAPGLGALKRALDAIGEVVVVAPERPRSASGHSITLHKPLRITEVDLPGGGKGWASNGTPSDCVTLGFDVVMEGRADLVFSGINAGPNLGWDLTYSGTVSAAMEGAILGVPSVAISVAGDRPPYDYGAAAEFAVRLARSIVQHGLEPWTLLNVNVPAIPRDQIAGVSITHQGRTQYVDRIDRRTDPWGRPYYWLCGNLKEDAPDPGSDVHAVLQGYISVTPVHLDLTAHHLLAELEQWSL